MKELFGKTIQLESKTAGKNNEPRNISTDTLEVMHRDRILTRRSDLPTDPDKNNMVYEAVFL